MSRNELSTVIRKVSRGIGAGLLEVALQREGGKGCSPILCSAPVSLEPPYQAFDGLAILDGVGPSECTVDEAVDPAWVTFRVYVSEEDTVPLNWHEVLLRAWAAFRGPFAFEVAGSAGRVEIRIAFPSDQVGGCLSCVHGLFPAIRLKEVARPFQPREPGLELAVEELIPVAPYHRKLSLIGDDGVSPLNIVYQAISALGRGEFGLYQVLIQPASPDHDWHFNVESLVQAEWQANNEKRLGGLRDQFSYDEILPSRLDPSTAKKVEKDCAMYAVVCRYAVWASDAARDGFFQAMRGATAVLRFGNHAWRRVDTALFIDVLGVDGLQRMVMRRRCHRPGLMLTSHEVASFFHFPNEWSLKMFNAVEQRKGLEWSPQAETVGASRPADLVVGTNEYAGNRVPIVVGGPWRLQHLLLTGKTGSGKSEWELSSACQDAESGQGLAVVDPHGDLYERFLSRVPERRLRDVVCLDFSQADLYPLWNPFLARTTSGKFADDFTRAFLATEGRTGPRMTHITRHAAFAVHRMGGTLADFAALLSDTEEGERLRRAAVNAVENPEARRFWLEEFGTYRGEDLTSVKNKLSRLFLHDVLVAMFGQRENTVEPRAWMDQRKIVAVNLASGILGTDFAHFLGGLLCSLIYRAALSRADIPEGERQPFFLYLDECQVLQTGALVEMLSEARKYGLGLVLAHQEMNQLDASLHHALDNCFARVVFQPGPNDAPFMRRVLLGQVREEELERLERGQAFAVIGNRVTSVATERCRAAVLRDGKEFARQLTAATYARLAPAATKPKTSVAAGAKVVRSYDGFGRKEDKS